MKTIPYTIIAVTGLVAFAYKLRDLRRDPGNWALRSLCVTFALMGTSIALAVPAVERKLELATGLLLIWAMAPVAIATTSLQITVLLWTYPLEEARPKIRLRLLLNGIAIVLICLPAFLTDVPAGTVARTASAEEHDRLFHGMPMLAESILLYLVVYGFSTWDCGVQAHRYRRVVNRRWLNRALAIVCVMAVVNMGYVTSRAIHVVGLRYFDTFLEPVYRVGPLFPAVGVTGAIFAWTMPAWGPRVDRIRAYRQLRPLWRALSEAIPEVVFEDLRLGRTGWWNLKDLDFRLYRRIIEIRDSHLALRPYLDEETAQAVRRRAIEANLDGDTLRATVEAATLAAALRAKAEGRPSARPAVEPVSGGKDLAEELIWLTKVAKAFTHSPLVASASAPGRVG